MTSEHSGDYVYVAPARNGRGLFVRVLMHREDRLLEVRGKIIDYEALDRAGGSVQDNAFRFGPETYLSPEGELGDFLNHSCEPNAKVVKEGEQLFIVAVGDIPADTEVTIDYATIIASDDIWEMACSCGSAHCRGRIASYTLLPADVQERYIKEGMIPQYIVDISASER